MTHNNVIWVSVVKENAAHNHTYSHRLKADKYLPVIASDSSLIQIWPHCFLNTVANATSKQCLTVVCTERVTFYMLYYTTYIYAQLHTSTLSLWWANGFICWKYWVLLKQCSIYCIIYGSFIDKLSHLCMLHTWLGRSQPALGFSCPSVILSEMLSILNVVLLIVWLHEGCISCMLVCVYV